MARIENSKREHRLLADQLYAKTEGKDFKADQIEWGDYTLHGKKLKLSDGKRALKTMAGRLHGFLKQKREGLWSWTLEARKIKEAGQLFVDQWPTKTHEDEDAPLPIPEPAPVPESPPVPDPGEGDILVPAGEVLGPEKPALPDVPQEILPDLPLLFLTPEESAAFQLLGAAPKPLRLSWLLDIGLGEDSGLFHFMQKLSGFGIIAQVPDQVEQGEVIYFLDTVKLGHYQEKHQIMDAAGALEGIKQELASLQEEKEKAEQSLGIQEISVRDATMRRDECQAQLEEAKKRLVEAEENLKDAESGLTTAKEGFHAMKTKISEQDYPAQIRSLEAVVNMAEMAASCSPLEQTKFSTFFFRPAGK